MTLSEVISLTGTHGTSASRALEIIGSKKFCPSTDGLMGYGVYFWEVRDSLVFSKELAKNWWRFASSPKNNVYKNDADKSLAIVKADIKPTSQEFFDATKDSFIFTCSQIAEDRGICFTKEELIKLRAAVLVDIENEMDINFSVVKIEADVPGQQKGDAAPPAFYWLKKQAACYVVKNKIEEVIQNIELIEA